MSATPQAVDEPTTVIIDIGPVRDGVTPVFPIPNDAPPPKLSRFGRPSPDHQWKAYNERGEHIGVLCVYEFPRDMDVIGLWVYGTKSGTRDWHFKADDTLKMLAQGRGLTGYGEAAVIFSPDDAPEPPRVAGVDPQIALPAQIVIGPASEAADALLDELSSENNIANKITTVPAGESTGSNRPRTEPATGNATHSENNDSRDPEVQSEATQVPAHEEFATAPRAGLEPRPTRRRRHGVTMPDDADDAPTDIHARPQTRAPEPHRPDAISGSVVASDVEPRALVSIWPGRIRTGEVTIIAGNPEAAKSTLLANIAATVSRGAVWPDQTENSPQGTVLLYTEDRLPEVVRPRLEAAGADLSHIHLASVGDQAVNLLLNFDRLEDQLRGLTGQKVIILDPLPACVGPAGLSNRTARQIMTNLTSLAHRTACAVIAVLFLKGRGARDPLTAIEGSRVFAQAARTIHLVCTDAANPNRRLFLPVKNNYGRHAMGLAFRVEEHRLGNAITTTAITFEAEPVTATAEDALRALGVTPEARSAVEEAKRLLLDILRDGPRLANDIYREAGAAGVSVATLRRAMAALDVQKRKTGSGPWLWQLLRP